MKHSSIFLGVICLAIMLLPACAPQPEPANEEIPDVEADIEAVKALVERFDAALNAGDADALSSLYTNDSVRMQADVPVWIGQQAIKAGFEKEISEFTFEVDNVVADVVVSGDWACARGSWKVTAAPQDEGEPIQASGSWMSFNQRQPDGSWKVVWDIWNRDAPLSQPE